MRAKPHRWFVHKRGLRRAVCSQCYMVRLHNPASEKLARRACKSAVS